MEYKDLNAIGMVRLMLTDGVVTEEQAARYFPELAERGDEKVRKELISFFTERAKHTEDSTFNGLSSKEIIAWLEKQGEQKLNYCHHEVDLSGCSEEYRKAYYDGWNNYNQQHAQLEAEQKPWSEDDLYMLKQTIRCVNNSGKLEVSTEEIEDWLKTLKDRVGSEANCTTTTEWSKEDNDMMKAIIEDVHMGADFREDVIREANEKEDWLKSIRRRYISLKNTCNWEPTEEKMEALKAATYCKDQAMSKVLFELYQDLEKVKKVRHEG